MSAKFIRDISASTIQVLLNQCLGLVIFIITSAFLSKEIYGEFNWSLAVLTLITSVLSLRLEQVIVRKVAVGENPSMLLTVFAAHIFFSGLLFYSLLTAASFVFPGFFSKHNLLLLLAIPQLLSFFASPFKNIANGKEDFRVLALMSSVGNLLRAAGLLFLLLYPPLSIMQVILLFTLSAAVELIACFLLAKYRLHAVIDTRYGIKYYVLLIRESLPQAGVVFFNVSIARIDWILLGLFTTPAITAEYSFAYRVYELSPLPMLIIAPVLLSRFSKLFGSGNEQQLFQHKGQLSMLIRMEMIAATSIPLFLNIIWTPVVDYLTANKYGAVNQATFLILSCCIPFLYMNNFFWSFHFAQNRLRFIFRVTAIVFFIILAGDLALIPLYNAKGAAIVYLAALAAEYLLYLSCTRLPGLRDTWTSPLACMAAAGLSGILAVQITNNTAVRLAFAFVIFCLVLLATKQLRKSDIRYIVKTLKPGSNLPGKSLPASTNEKDIPAHY